VTAPPLPRPVRALNRAGALAGAAGLRWPSLAPEALLRRAARRTGLSDFGDDFFREPLARLVDSLEREARLTTLGRIVARRDLLRTLEGRLRVEEVRRRHPEIAKEPVRAPIFVIGLPRTGTTILHELLAQDPANRVPMTWEVMHPWPPPERETFERDPRIETVEAHFAGIDRLLPDFKRMHPMGARLPQECVAITAFELATMIHHTTYRVPAYEDWLEATDLGPVYASHRRWLQYLQWRCPAERWVLKSPAHLWALDALLAEYPDARLVMTHRDPLRVVASLASLVTALRGLASDAVDPHEIGADWTRRLAAGLRRAVRVRDAVRLPDDRIFDLHFEEFVGNEIASVRRLYERFGLALSPGAEARMRRFLAENPRDKHGAHRYHLRNAGLDPATERRRYAEVVERFGIVPEAVD